MENFESFTTPSKRLKEIMDSEPKLEPKFKVGDLVILSSFPEGYGPGWNSDMNKAVGKECRISHVCAYDPNNKEHRYRVEFDDGSLNRTHANYYWPEMAITLVKAIEPKTVEPAPVVISAPLRAEPKAVKPVLKLGQVTARYFDVMARAMELKKK